MARHATPQQHYHKTGGRPELWLAGLQSGVGLTVAALVGALVESAASAATRDVLWTLTGTGIVVMLLCLAGYLTQRRG